MSIKIISRYSSPGGSTVAFINLTNELNKAGYETTFYGPHEWHLNKCKSDLLRNISITPNDNIITHLFSFYIRPKVRKVILSCHEKYWFEISKLFQYWDVCVFLNEEQRNYHKNYKGKYVIIPNICESINSNVDRSKLDKIAGVIGAIEDRKKTHLSIQRALRDGCEKVYLYGVIQDKKYFDWIVKPFLSDKVIYKGFVENKKEIYDSIGRVYHSSKGECASLVKDECESCGIKFFGSKETENKKINMTNEEIINAWVKLLEIN